MAVDAPTAPAQGQQNHAPNSGNGQGSALPTAADLGALTELVKSMGQQIKAQNDKIEELSKPVYRGADPASLFGPTGPHVREGENPLTSRGYSFLKAIGYISGVLSADEAKVEIDTHNKLHQGMVAGTGYKKAGNNTFMMPFSVAHMPLATTDPKLVNEIRELVKAGPVGGGYRDPQESFMLRVKYWGLEKALSWIDESVGGSLVAPPQMGELIELFRNNEALMAAGARDIGMPPQGRITYPRHTSASSAYWLGQSQTITDSEVGTGDLLLTAKKLAVLVKIPNELFRFASIAIEQFVREDMARVMALRFDKSALEAVGSDLEPKGLLNYAGIQNHTALTTGTDGDTFTPEDVNLMIGKVEERNAAFNAWIMRPLMYSVLMNRRADAVTGGDGAGPFLFNMFREFNTNLMQGRGIGSLQGYKAVRSTNVANNRVKGSGTALSYVLGGDFTDMIMALGGVIEFLVSNQGDTMVEKDQTWVRGIHYVDCAPRHEASFIKCDTLTLT